MKCAKCHKEAPSLYRTNPQGEVGIFYCKECLAKYEPELYANNNDDGLGPIIKIIEEIFANKKKRYNG